MTPWWYLMERLAVIAGLVVSLWTILTIATDRLALSAGGGVFL